PRGVLGQTGRGRARHRPRHRAFQVQVQLCLGQGPDELGRAHRKGLSPSRIDRGPVIDYRVAIPLERSRRMAETKPVTQDRVETCSKELTNWGRWGHDDQRGTFNLITPVKRAQAVSLVRTGRTVSLARDIGPQPAIMYNVTFPSARERADVVLDRFDLVYHGFTITHIDALCHVAWDGELYNGRSFKDSLTAAGASRCAID